MQTEACRSRFAADGKNFVKKKICKRTNENVLTTFNSTILELPQALKVCKTPLDECTETASKDEGPKGNKRNNQSSL